MDSVLAMVSRCIGREGVVVELSPRDASVHESGQQSHSRQAAHTQSMCNEAVLR